MRIRLKEARNKKAVTQKEIALYLGMAVNSYQNIEYGICGTIEAKWLKLFEYFDGEYPLHELMKNTERKET